MALPVPTTIATGFSDLQGSSYRLNTDQLYVADAGGSSSISTVGAHSHVKTIVGTGYISLHDIELSADGIHAYVAESPGSLLLLSLTNMNRSAATVLASGFSTLQQIALDEAHGFAYVAEFTGGHIWQVGLTAPFAKTVVATIASPRGLLVTDDGRFLYVSSDAGAITRFDLVTKTNVVIASGLTGPKYLEWADAGESVILFPQNTGDVYKADLTTTPATVTAIAGPAATNPYSLAVLSSNQLLISSGLDVAEVDLTASVFSAAGPILLGIGFVPNDAANLPNGYADTTVTPAGYFFQVKDSPFGGTLPLMINWEGAHTAGANFYQVFIQGPSGPAVQVTQPFNDYLWSVALNEFELVSTSPTNGYYPLRSAGQIWLNVWLGLLLDTTGRPNGLNTISVKLFSSTIASSEIGNSTLPGRFATLMIDNTTPVVQIQQILQQPGNVPVGACAIVNTGTPTFTFVVTASAPQSHLLGWNLVAYWGNNQSSSPPVSSDSYSNHISPTRLWAGITGVAVPPPGPTPWNATVAGDPTSTHCAHSFFLNAWDRVINGWGYIHGVASYQQSITLLF